MGSERGEKTTASTISKRVGTGLTTKAGNNLNVYYTNVDNSLLSKMEELQCIVSEFSYDIIAVNEVKPKNGKIASKDTLKLDGYEFFSNDFDQGDTRGVCIYVKKHLSATQLTPNNSHQFSDSVWVCVKDSSGSNESLFGCIYRSGTIATAKKYDKGLLEQLLWASSDCNQARKIIIGDFNYPNVNWSPEPSISSVIPSNSNSRTLSSEHIFVECIRDTFFHQLITEETRFRNESSSVLDLLFTNEPSVVEQIRYLEPLGASDHGGISFKVPVESSPLPRCKRLLYNRGNYDKLRSLLSINWDSILEDANNLQETYDLFERILQDGITACIPTKKTPSITSNKPLWMVPDAIKSSKVKRHLWAKYKQTRHRNDYKTYAKARNKNSHDLRKARRKFERKLARNIKSNVKSFWNYVNAKKKNKSKVNDLKDSNGEFVSLDDEKAEILNNQYAKTFTIEDTDEMPAFQDNPSSTSTLTNIIITEEDVLLLLLALRIDKSPGPDEIHPRVLKEVAAQIAKPLARIYQWSLSSGEVPYQWKLANICPIFKKGSRSCPENYRPVSLTSVLSKLLEKLVGKQIMEHVLTNNIVPKQQHGFLKGKSTATNLLESLNMWIEMQEHNVPVDVIYLDYSKAFDTVPHRRLVKKLESVGINGSLLNWIENFLNGRKQRVVVNGVMSRWIEVLSGVPQGSVLGPLLFLIFVSDIPSLIENSISLFADDTKLYGKNCGTSLQDDLTKLVEWTKLMQMCFNASKCKVMHLGKQNPCIPYTMLNANNEQCILERTYVEKDLGVHVDEQLSFKEHVVNQVNKANRALGALKHTFKFMDKYSFKYLYKSLIRPHLEYASVAWSARFRYSQDLLERVQRRATKIVPELKNLPYSSRLEILDLHTLSFRRKRTDVLQMYKFTHGFDYFDFDYKCEVCGRPVFEKTMLSSTRGHPYKLQHHLCGPIKKHSFFGRVVPLWNNLKSETVCSETVNEFKNNLAKEWNNNQDLFGYTFSY